MQFEIRPTKKPRLEANPAGFLAEGAPLKTARQERTGDILTVYFGRGGNGWRTGMAVLAGVTDRAGSGGRAGSSTLLDLAGHAARYA